MEIFLSFWDYLTVTAPYLILGLGMAGLLHAFVNVEFIKRHLGGKGLAPILKASLFGIPLPLCSCSVIPAAVELRKSGASNGSTSSFLISTPESGVDSIAMTYAMMDFPMTVLRPLAALITSLSAGIFQNFFNFFEISKTSPAPQICCPKMKARQEQQQLQNKDQRGVKEGLKKSLRYAFVDLSNDLAVWLSIGLILGGLLTFFVPQDFFEGMNGWQGRLIVLGVGVPVYICASASTPIAASLVLKGMSPGTALIFLLVGPATNISNITVLQNYIGKRGVLINILAIALVSLGLSYGVDFLYSHFTWPLDFQIGHEHKSSSLISHLCTFFLIFLLFKGVLKKIRA